MWKVKMRRNDFVQANSNSSWSSKELPLSQTKRLGLRSKLFGYWIVNVRLVQVDMWVIKVHGCPGGRYFKTSIPTVSVLPTFIWMKRVRWWSGNASWTSIDVTLSKVAIMNMLKQTKLYTSLWIVANTAISLPVKSRARIWRELICIFFCETTLNILNSNHQREFN